MELPVIVRLFSGIRPVEKSRRLFIRMTPPPPLGVFCNNIICRRRGRRRAPGLYSFLFKDIKDIAIIVFISFIDDSFLLSVLNKLLYFLIAGMFFQKSFRPG